MIKMAFFDVDGTLFSHTMHKIPNSTRKALRLLREKGIKKLRGNTRGDQYVKVVVETPKNLTDRQKELLRELAKESGDEVHEKKRSFGQKIEDMFKKK
jgi:molecular chaperone DnaJ